MNAHNSEEIVESLISNTEALLREGAAQLAVAIEGLDKICAGLRERGAPPMLLERLERYAASLRQSDAQDGLDRDAGMQQEAPEPTSRLNCASERASARK